MKTKEQALAQADAMLAPAEAARQRKVGARLEMLFHSYPGLRRIAGDDPQAVLDEAARHARRQWVLYLPFVAVLTYVVYVLYATDLLTQEGPDRWMIWMPLTAFGTTALVKRYLMRAYIKKAAKSYGGSDHESTPRA